MPDWNDFAPRMALVYDLMGNGRTALKYSLNRYNLSRTTGIAAAYNPLVSATATLPWRDVNGNDQADGALRCTGYPSAACEIDFTGLSQNFGIAALNEYGEYPRTWNFEQGVEVQHELFSGLSLSGAWWSGDFHNLTTTIDRSYTHADYVPYTFYNPTTGQPFEVYARTVTRPTSNLDTYDPERENKYESFVLDGRWRIPGGGQLSGGMSFERERLKACTSPDDPNYGGNGKALVRRVRPRHSLPAAVQALGHEGHRVGRQPGRVVPEQLEPDQLARHDGDPRRDALSRQLPVALPGRRRSSCRPRTSRRPR